MAINKSIEVYHNFYFDNDNKEEKMVKFELNKNTRNRLLEEYKFKLVDYGWHGNESDYDIIISKSEYKSDVRNFHVIKNDSSCGGKHLMLLCDPEKLLLFGGESKGSILTIYGGRE